MKKVLSIAGSDCSGGAGIQADIKTITAHGLYGMSAITALTAQNTMGVFRVLEADAEFVAAQLDAVFSDIMPDSVKIGMVSNAQIIQVIAAKLKQYHAKNIVVDPVMVTTSGSRLLCDNAVTTLKDELLTHADIITPNILEAEVLCRFQIKSEEDMETAAQIITSFTNAAILIKGGHLEKSANDLLYENGKTHWFYGEKINNANTHGTGCTLSSAIACNLAKGHAMIKSVQNAKDYLTLALKAGLDLGKGRGPLNHCFHLEQGWHS